MTGKLMMVKSDDTINYYNNNADSFFTSTVDANMDLARDRFLSQVKGGGRLLDFGCGSGRDARAFLRQGYQVEAVDGSKALCEKAAKLLGQPVKCMDFRELSEEEKYDGIWACASILHLPWKELQSVIMKIRHALKSEGTAYLSFKYGTFEGIRNGRYFTDMTEQRLQETLPEGVIVIDEWISYDVRPGREAEKWLNVIVKKG